jgi:hypothetical protein
VAIQHLQEHIAACRETLEVMRRSGSFMEYRLLMGEREAAGSTD